VIKHKEKLKAKLLPEIEPSTKKFNGRSRWGYRCVSDDGCIQTWQGIAVDGKCSFQFEYAPYRVRGGKVHVAYRSYSWGPDAKWVLNCRIGSSRYDSPTRELNLDDVTCKMCLREFRGFEDNEWKQATKRSQDLVAFYGKDRMVFLGKGLWVVPSRINVRGAPGGTVKRLGFKLAKHFDDGWWEMDGPTKAHKLHAGVLRGIHKMRM
jgi:hypothetical protein